MVLWISIAFVALLLTWLMLQLSQQGAAAQIENARQQAAVSCETIRVGAARVRAATAPGYGAAGEVPPSAAQAVIDLALRDQAGVEGGIWRADQGVVAYAFPTYDGSGIKRDPPAAELDRIGATAQRAQAAASLTIDVRPGLREAVVFAACPVDTGATIATRAALPDAATDKTALIAWTLQRVSVIRAEVVNQLTTAMTLLLGSVIVSGAWLGWTLARWRRHAAQLSGKLAQSERLATLGRISAGLAHEIRNPLATMRMKAENALAAPLEVRDKRVASALESVLSQTERLEGLVSSLLALTQPFRVDRKPLDLRLWLAERVQIHADAAVKHGISMVLKIDEETAVHAQPLALLDPLQMDRALDNLLLNALAHTPYGGTIEIGARRTANGALLLWVADDGVGIPEALRENLFEPFTTARAGGTGLGLALVREIVQAHGGRVSLADTSRATNADTDEFLADPPLGEATKASKSSGTRIDMEFPWPAS
ncbi:sensor histidine kinase [Pigmentiphaga aceris]|uniref:histidine kinase n=1 Tax=Pigmentiphaga aceris TaxID=1940612 RepID=A0A5C0B4Z4_9BURK|nr:sensor histidine kinase [Pigmentiphaga aceris]